MSTANLTRTETAARAAALVVRHYRVQIDLSAARDPDVGTFPVRATLAVDVLGGPAHTWLDFLGGEVTGLQIDGTGAAIDYDGARLTLPALSGRHTITVTGRARYSRSGEGMHRFVDPADGETYLYTQYEPSDARRVFPCCEQPDIKAPFTFLITAPADWTVLSNRTALARREIGDGAVQTEFAPTLPMSTYLTAVVAGPYTGARGTWRRGELEVPLGVYCRRSLAAHLDSEELLTVTRQGLDFFHDAFDHPYPWGKYDQVFVPEYNLGAMENPGCVTFTEAYVFRGEATDAQREGRAVTLLHEMAHMWFGDLVTPRWWQDLWLKESFADYMGQLACAEATEYRDAWVSFADRRKAWAYAQDQLPTTHPIVADITDLEAAKLNFDGITYAKGAAVLKQLVAYVGREAFFAGAREYFADHAFAATTLDDLLVALERASGRDLRGWAAAWLQTTGMSTLRLERAEGGWQITQTDPRPHRIAVGSYAPGADGRLERIARTEIDLEAACTPVTLPAAALHLVNDDDLTYAKIRLDPDSLATAEAQLSDIGPVLARGLVWAGLWDAARDGALPVERYLETVARHAPGETRDGLLSSVLTHAEFAITRYLPDAERERWRGRWAGVCREAMAAAPAGGLRLAWARAWASAAATAPGEAEQVAAMLATGGADSETATDQDLRWSLLTALVAVGRAGEVELDAELGRDRTASGRIARMRALAARPGAETFTAAWERAMTDTALTNDELDALIAGLRTGDRRAAWATRDEDYFAALTGLWSSRSIEIARRLVIGLYPDAEDTATVDRWWATHPQAPAALRRLIAEQRDHQQRALRLRTGGVL